jgi:hypothetical protein
MMVVDSHYSVDLAAQNHYSVAQSHHSPCMTAQRAGVTGYMTMRYTHRNLAVPAVDMQQAQVCHNWDLPQ